MQLRTAIRAYSSQLLGSVDERKAALKELHSILQGILEEDGLACSSVAWEFFKQAVLDGAGGQPVLEGTALADTTQLSLTKAAQGLQGEEAGGDALDAFESYMDGAIHAAMFDAANQTIDAAGQQNGGAKYALVPSGKETCAYCTMLASRGFVYSKEGAKSLKEHIHRGCDCVVVACKEDAEQYHEVEGYDWKKYEDMYVKAISHEATGYERTKLTLKNMRRMYGLK